MLSEELKLASPDLDAIERWRAKEAECARRAAELDGVRGEREGVRSCFIALKIKSNPCPDPDTIVPSWTASEASARGCAGTQ